MSVTIRLSRIGKKFAPSYKIVVSTTKYKRNGKFLDILGFYNPSEKPEKFSLDKKKFDEWVAKGAKSTEAAQALYAGKYEHTAYKRKSSIKATETESAEKTSVSDNTPTEKSTTVDSNTSENTATNTDLIDETVVADTKSEDNSEKNDIVIASSEVVSDETHSDI